MTKPKTRKRQSNVFQGNDDTVIIGSVENSRTINFRNVQEHCTPSVATIHTPSRNGSRTLKKWRRSVDGPVSKYSFTVSAYFKEPQCCLSAPSVALSPRKYCEIV